MQAGPTASSPVPGPRLPGGRSTPRPGSRLEIGQRNSWAGRLSAIAWQYDATPYLWLPPVAARATNVIFIRLIGPLRSLEGPRGMDHGAPRGWVKAGWQTPVPAVSGDAREARDAALLPSTASARAA